ncbi:MAG TPA: hypothetical protein VFK06_08295 [Candidatus Angelobacter sp.]|nr:hypothetical protein [Candidatus Angelobacter sp.]
MKLCRIAAIVALLTASCASAQVSGDTLIVQLSQNLNAKKLRIGDKVSAKTIQDLIVGGKIMLPRNSKLIGHITDVLPLTKADPRSRLAMVFERVERNGNSALPVHAVVQALGPPLPPDPALESVLTSQSYGGSEYRHAGNAGNTGDTSKANTAIPAVVSGRRSTATDAYKRREGELEDAGHAKSESNNQHGTVLTVRSHGVFGLHGLALASTSPVPVIVAVGQNVELKSGTQIVLQVH